MTVKDLRKLLAEAPDDAPVYTFDGRSGVGDEVRSARVEDSTEYTSAWANGPIVEEKAPRLFVINVG